MPQQNVFKGMESRKNSGRFKSWGIKCTVNYTTYKQCGKTRQIDAAEQSPERHPHLQHAMNFYFVNITTPELCFLSFPSPNTYFQVSVSHKRYSAWDLGPGGEAKAHLCCSARRKFPQGLIPCALPGGSLDVGQQPALHLRSSFFGFSEAWIGSL